MEDLLPVMGRREQPNLPLALVPTSSRKQTQVKLAERRVAGCNVFNLVSCPPL